MKDDEQKAVIKWIIKTANRKLMNLYFVFWLILKVELEKYQMILIMYFSRHIKN